MSATQVAHGIAGTPSAPKAGLRGRLQRLPWPTVGLVTVVVVYLVWSIAPVLIAFLFSFNNGIVAEHLAGFLAAMVDRAELCVQRPDIQLGDRP